MRCKQIPGIKCAYRLAWKRARLCSVGYVQNHTGGGSSGYYATKSLCESRNDLITRTREMCKFCTTFIPVPRTFVSSVRLLHNIRGTGIPLSQHPGTVLVVKTVEGNNINNSNNENGLHWPVPGTRYQVCVTWYVFRVCAVYYQSQQYYIRSMCVLSPVSICRSLASLSRIFTRVLP